MSIRWFHSLFLLFIHSYHRPVLVLSENIQNYHVCFDHITSFFYSSLTYKFGKKCITERLKRVYNHIWAWNDFIHCTYHSFSLIIIFVLVLSENTQNYYVCFDHIVFSSSCELKKNWSFIYKFLESHSKYTLEKLVSSC